MQGSGGEQTTSQVEIKDMAFNPPTMTISAGATVTWVNQDKEAHTVDGTKEVFHSKPLGTGDKFAHTYKKAGTFPYYCKLHPQMKGEIIVK